jgi:hypothetical protein
MHPQWCREVPILVQYYLHRGCTDCISLHRRGTQTSVSVGCIVDDVNPPRVASYVAIGIDLHRRWKPVRPKGFEPLTLGSEEAHGRPAKKPESRYRKPVYHDHL